MLDRQTDRHKLRHAEFISASNQCALVEKILKPVQDDVRRGNFFSHFPLASSLRPAYTLAEVLITLGIIGVVAAMTIPTLIQNTQEKATVTALKKSYSNLSQAYTMAVQENGTPDEWNLVIYSVSGQGAVDALNTMAPYLKLTKNCGMSLGCFPQVTYPYLNAPSGEVLDSIMYYAKAQLSDGSIMHFLIRNKDCADVNGTSLPLQNTCGDIGIDVNGFKGPNAFGKDYFRFYFTKYGIIPKGTPEAGGFPYCLLNHGSGNGEACAAWVIFNENMDYLKCSNLSWTGKKKCG